MARGPVAAVGVVCWRGDEVLLIRRAAPPLQGAWSLPGGKIAWGERAKDAALRELREETSVEATLAGLIDVVDGLFEPAAADGRHYVLVDYAARWTGGTPRAGDDAIEARFFGVGELGGLGLWSDTLRIIDASRSLVSRDANP